MKKFYALLLSLLLVIPAMAHDIADGTNLYFANTNSWSAAQFILGHNSWSEGYVMNKVANTNLYHLRMIEWGGYTQWCVFAQSGKWGGEGNSVQHRHAYMGNNKTPVKTVALNSGSGKCNLILPDGTFTKPNAYTELNHTQTINVEGEGTTTISTYRLTAASTASASNGTDSADAVYTANVNVTATAAEGSKFVGWFDGETLLSDNTSYKYTAANAAKTIVAKFEKVAVDAPVLSNFVATPAEGIEVGTTVTFECEVENAVEGVNVVYTVDGVALEGDTWTPDYIGTYAVKATYEGAASLSMELTVALPSDYFTFYEGEFAIFFVNTENRNPINAWVWRDGGANYAASGTWPGDALTEVVGQLGGFDCYKWVYSGNETADPTHVIFNNKVGDSGVESEKIEYVNGGVYAWNANNTVTLLGTITPAERLYIKLQISSSNVFVGDEVTFSYTTNVENVAEDAVKYYVNGVESAATWTPAEAGEYTVEVKVMDGETEVVSDSGIITVREHTSFNVYLLKEGAWETTCIYYWDASGNNAWPGATLSEIVTIGGQEYYKYAIVDKESVNIIFNNNNNGSQTVDIVNVTKDSYYRITTEKDGNNYKVATLTAPETLVFTVTVPAGTKNCYIVGNFTSWTPLAMEMVSENQYTTTVDNLIRSQVKYKYVTNADVNTDDIWKNEEVTANGDHVDSRNYNESDTVAKWKGLEYYEENIVCGKEYWLYCNGQNWAADGAWFAAYFFNKNTNEYTWVKGEVQNKEVAPENYYVKFELANPSESEESEEPEVAPLAEEEPGTEPEVEAAPVYTHMIFARMNANYDVMGWNEGNEGEEGFIKRVWNQTGDIVWDGKSDVFKLTSFEGGEWDPDDDTTGIEAVEAQGGIVYAGGVVSAEGAIYVYNLSGAVVACGDDNVDLRGLNSGVYVVRNGNNVLKVVR